MCIRDRCIIVTQMCFDICCNKEMIDWLRCNVGVVLDSTAQSLQGWLTARNLWYSVEIEVISWPAALATCVCCVPQTHPYSSTLADYPWSAQIADLNVSVFAHIFRSLIWRYQFLSKILRLAIWTYHRVSILCQLSFRIALSYLMDMVCLIIQLTRVDQ